MTAADAEDRVVLVVDDDESIRETLQMALELDGYATAFAGNGEEALLWLRKNPAPRLILLDLMMPGMDGWQMFEHLCNDEQLARIPVVVITAFGRDLGTVGKLPILKKPFDLQELLRVVGDRAQPGCP
jgi:two-component system, chemotaxis family, chemotaxis protein CheY